MLATLRAKTSIVWWQRLFSRRGKDTADKPISFCAAVFDMPRWLAFLHRLVSLLVVVVLCLVAIMVTAALVAGARSCYQRSVHAACEWRASLPAIYSAD